MRLVFAGTPEFSVPALDGLHAAGHQIVGVYTQPDRPAGRGRKLLPSAVATRASELGLPLFTPEKLAGPALDELSALAPEVMVVVAYGLILSQAVLDTPTRGCFNIHASLLPRWRGAAPIQRAILAGDAQTGVTIMRMDAGLDTGPMLLREAVAIGGQNAAGLQATLSRLGARLMVEALDRLDSIPETPQPPEGATYARKLSKAEARLDWSAPAIQLDRCVRAYNPAPVAWTQLGDERLRIFKTELRTGGGAAPGTITRIDNAGMEVACGEGSLCVTSMQRPGGKVIVASAAPRDWLGRKLGSEQDFH